MKFAGDDALALTAPAGLFGLPLDRADLMHLAQNGLLGLIGLVALLFVFRPMVTRLTALAPPALQGMALPGMGGAQGIATLADPKGHPLEDAALLQGPGGVKLLSAPDGAAGLADEDGLVHLGQVDGQLRASSIRRLAELVDKHPEESLSIVRAWMQEGAA